MLREAVAYRLKLMKAAWSKSGCLETERQSELGCPWREEVQTRILEAFETQRHPDSRKLLLLRSLFTRNYHGRPSPA